MKLESLKMNLKSLKSQVINEKGCLFKGKITKSSVTFCKNKPNFKIGNININSLITSKYAKMVKNQSSIINNHLKSKPNQTQFKPYSKPICVNAIIALSSFMTIKYVKSEDLTGRKTNPNKAKVANLSSMDNQLSLIDNHLRRQTQFKPKQSQFQRISTNLTTICLKDILNVLNFTRKNVKIDKRIIP